VSDEYFARLVQDAELIDQVSTALSPATQAEQVHARHILVDTEEKGQEVLSRLAAGEDFAALAAEYSTDPGSKDSGGDLGWFPKGMMVPAFEEAAFSLAPGATSDLVKTDYGYHIIQVLEKGMRDLDEQALSTQRQTAFENWLTEKKAAAQIEIVTKFATEQ
jgi:parvulin-like peptidyl-prolyl isomerase